MFVNHPYIHDYKAPPPLPYPCMTGVSNAHCMALSGKLGVPVKKLPFGVELLEHVPKRDNKGYLLYFGRIVKERGVHEAIDLAKRRRMPLVIAGDDRFGDQGYVMDILKRCDGELIKYFGAVGENVKLKLMAEAHCLIVPYLSDEDAYCCQTVKLANAMGVPSVALWRGAVAEVMALFETGMFPILPSLESLYDFDFQNIPQLAPDPIAARPTYERLDELIEMAVNEPW